MTESPRLRAFDHCRRELATCVLLTVLLALISLVPALTVGVILDRVIQTRAFATLLAVLVAFGLFFVREAVFTYVHDRLMLYITHSAVVQAETDFWHIVSEAPYPELERLSEDDGLARFLSIGTDVRFRADWAVAIASVPLCLVIGMSAMFLVSPVLTWPIAGLTVIFTSAHLSLTRSQRRAARELHCAREAELELAAVEQLFRGALSLKAHRAFKFGTARWIASPGRPSWPKDCRTGQRRAAPFSTACASNCQRADHSRSWANRVRAKPLCSSS